MDKLFKVIQLDLSLNFDETTSGLADVLQMIAPSGPNMYQTFTSQTDG